MQQIYTIGNRSSTCIGYLVDFNNLTHLTIKNSRSENGDEGLVMFAAMNECPKLISYEFDSQFDTPDIIADTLLDSMDSSSVNNQK